MEISCLGSSLPVYLCLGRDTECLPVISAGRWTTCLPLGEGLRGSHLCREMRLPITRESAVRLSLVPAERWKPVDSSLLSFVFVLAYQPDALACTRLFGADTACCDAPSPLLLKCTPPTYAFGAQ